MWNKTTSKSSTSSEACHHTVLWNAAHVHVLSPTSVTQA